ncbi:MAG: hypothetical protein Q7S88_01785 [Candidatus Daviesbacteria bacterium]|nr:hypothetical protein [Candidatus Daviesbacteria bacterium]
MNERKYKVYMMGAVSGEDGPKTRDLRARLGDIIVRRQHQLLSPHVAYDFEQTTFREKIGGLDNICGANLALMDQAEVFIAEGSGASEGRGFEVAFGLLVKMCPVLYLREEKWGRGTSMIFGNSHPLLYVAMYNQENLESVFDQAIERVPVMLENLRKVTK